MLDPGGMMSDDRGLSECDSPTFAWSVGGKRGNIVTCNGYSWLLITGSGWDDWMYWHFYYNYNELQEITFLTGLRVSSLLLWLAWFWVGHFFSFRCPLVNAPQLNTQVSYEIIPLTRRWLSYEWHRMNWVWVLYYDRRSVGQSVLE
jgi:hypothetical protein